MTYEEKKAIADNYLAGKAGVSWDELTDINSLHECETEEDIVAACDARLSEDDFPEDLRDELMQD